MEGVHTGATGYFETRHREGRDQSGEGETVSS